MSLLDKIKRLFAKSSLPEETQLLLSGVEDVEELRSGLDEIATRNEVEAREIEREIEKLAKMEEAHKERVRVRELNEREKLSTLREIQRLRRRMDSLEKRHRIHQDNIDLHLGLFDRISEMQAMELKRVNQNQIEEIAVDYDEKLEKHRDIMSAARASTGLEGSYEDSSERRELAQLEQEILAEGEEPEAQPKEAEAEAEPAPPEAAEEERPATGEAAEEEPAASEPAAGEAAEEEPAASEPAAEEGDGAQRPARRPLEEELAQLENRKGDGREERTLEVE